MIKAYKYRIYPNSEQKVLMSKHFGCARWIYNYALNDKITMYQKEGKSRSRFDIQKDLVGLKTTNEWLKEINSQSLQASLEHLDNAFTRFFKQKKGFPKYKSKHDNRQSFSIPQNTKVDFENNILSIPKCKSGIKIKLHRTFEGKIKTSTITKTPTGKYFISILVDVVAVNPNKKPLDENKAIGIDLGIKMFATLSNGIEIPNNKYLKKSLEKLKRDQRRLSRKVKGSKNIEKQRLKLARVYEKISNQRTDFLHKTTHYLTTTYDTICLETLNVKGMVKNHKLSQALSDIAIGTFGTMIDYKAERTGTNIIRIGMFEPSSKMCSCGVINKDLKLSQRVWTCSVCGTTHQRDVLASNNIKRFAFLKNNTVGTIGINACGDDTMVSSVKQEATIPLG